MRIFRILSENGSGDYRCKTGLGRTEPGELVGKPETGNAGCIGGVACGCGGYQGYRHLLPDARVGVRG